MPGAALLPLVKKGEGLGVGEEQIVLGHVGDLPVAVEVRDLLHLGQIHLRLLESNESRYGNGSCENIPPTILLSTVSYTLKLASSEIRVWDQHCAHHFVSAAQNNELFLSIARNPEFVNGVALIRR